MTRQLPAWSPLSLGTLRAALRGLTGARVADRLREAVTRAYGTDRLLLTDSGTTALALALRAAGPPGVRVALPAYGCYDLATAALGAGATVRLYDLDPATLGPDPGSLEAALGSGVDAVVSAHLYGIPADLTPFRTLLDRHGVTVVDDAAQGVGGALDGRSLGGAGDWGVLSFGRGKGRTGGSGGALLAFSERARARFDQVVSSLPGTDPTGRMGDWIKLAAQWALGRPSLYTIPSAIPWLHLGETRYHPPHPPDRMSRLAQAALWATWEPSARESGCRRALAERWKQVLEGQNDIQPIVVRAGSEPGWLRFPVVVAPGLVSPFCSPSARRLGIMPGYPGPLDRLLPLKPSLLDSEGSRWTGAETLVERLFTLPTHSRLSSEAQHRIGQFLQSVRLS